MLLVDLDANVVEAELQLRKVMEVLRLVLEVLCTSKEAPSLLEDLSGLDNPHSKDQLLEVRQQGLPSGSLEKDFALDLLSRRTFLAGCGRGASLLVVLDSEWFGKG